jgi:hypothetical protein
MSKIKNPSNPFFLLNTLFKGVFGIAKTKVARVVARIIIVFYLLSLVFGYILYFLGIEYDNLIVLAATIAILIIRFFYLRRKR